MSTVSDMNFGTSIPSISEEPMFRLSVAQYHEMIEHGILTTDDPVELLEGYLVTKMPKKRRHSLVTQRSRIAIEKLLPPGWFLDVQEPVTLQDSEPEPDISVIRGNREQFRDQHPTGSDVGMLVETADTSLRRDRGWKKKVYARAEIPVYWIINLVDEQVEFYSKPGEVGGHWDYQDITVFRVGQEVPLVLDGLEVDRIPVKELLGS